MRDKHLLGVDIGTQGTKAALFSEAGQCLSYAFVPSRLHRPAAGTVEEDPEVQVRSALHTIRECIRKARIDPRSVAGIGIDGQMAGIIGVGKDGRHVTPYDSWLDTRCAPYILKMQRAAGDEVLARTGCSPSFNHGPKKLWWMHERKKDFQAIAAFVQPGGYAAMRLCGLSGREAFIDTTYLHFSGFADNQHTRWDGELCRRFHLDMAKLPRIVDPQTIVGEVAPSVARECGLPPGVPVVAGCGDTAASFLSCGATEVGICVDVAGTASVFAATVARFRPDRKHGVLACGHSATPGLWHSYAYINGGGMNLEWFLRELANRGQDMGATLKRSLRVSSADPAHSHPQTKFEGGTPRVSGALRRGTLTLEDLSRLAEQAPPDDDAPLFVPHLGGRVCPSQPHLRGAWVGLSWNHSLGHLFRAVLEGVALEYGIYREVLLTLYNDFRLKELRVTGGGEKSALWNSLKADVLGTPVIQVTRTEGAPLGAALLAGFGVGLFRDLSRAAKQWIQTGKVNRPHRTMGAYYQRRLQRYGSLLAALNEIATR